MIATHRVLRIRSTIESIVAAELSLGNVLAAGVANIAQRKRDFVSTPVTNRPTLMIDSDPGQPRSGCVGVYNLDPDLIASLGRYRQAGRLLDSIFRVRVVDSGVPGDEDLPHVFGRYQVLEGGLRFIPHFPFESGIHYRVSFDPRPFGRSELSEVLTLEFLFPKVMSVVPTRVQHVFPSGNSLPENLLRFYICFSNSMQRGRAEEHIMLLGADGRPALDTLYRSPVELWDRSLRHLTILLDPGRLKRGVGPNRELGPPLKAGLEYTLAVGSGMIDISGRPLCDAFYKRFRVTKAVREPVAVERWKVVPPETKTRQPLVLIFPRPLDWALLSQTISIAGEQSIDGRIVIDQCERRWSFTPTSPWVAGSYHVGVESRLEDVCGNSVIAPFDRPIKSDGDCVDAVANTTLSFHLAEPSPPASISPVESSFPNLPTNAG